MSKSGRGLEKTTQNWIFFCFERFLFLHNKSLQLWRVLLFENEKGKKKKKNCCFFSVIFYYDIFRICLKFRILEEENHILLFFFFFFLFWSGFACIGSINNPIVVWFQNHRMTPNSFSIHEWISLTFMFFFSLSPFLSLFSTNVFFILA